MTDEKELSLLILKYDAIYGGDGQGEMCVPEKTWKRMVELARSLKRQHTTADHEKWRRDFGRRKNA